MTDHAALVREGRGARPARALASSLGFLDRGAGGMEPLARAIGASPRLVAARVPRALGSAGAAGRGGGSRAAARSGRERLGPVMEQLAGLGGYAAESLQRFAAAWMGARWGHAISCPSRHRTARPSGTSASGSAPRSCHSSRWPLRPGLERYFAATRELPWASGRRASAPGAAACRLRGPRRGRTSPALLPSLRWA